MLVHVKALSEIMFVFFDSKAILSVTSRNMVKKLDVSMITPRPSTRIGEINSEQCIGAQKEILVKTRDLFIVSAFQKTKIPHKI